MQCIFLFLIFQFQNIPLPIVNFQSASNILCLKLFLLCIKNYCRVYSQLLASAATGGGQAAGAGSSTGNGSVTMGVGGGGGGGMFSTTGAHSGMVQQYAHPSAAAAAAALYSPYSATAGTFLDYLREVRGNQFSDCSFVQAEVMHGLVVFVTVSPHIIESRLCSDSF